MRHLTTDENMDLNIRITSIFGGTHGLRDLHALKSANNQPKAGIYNSELYKTVVDKAAVLCFSIIQNHPYTDGNKRTAHVAMETFLVMNGKEITASTDEQESMMLAVASGDIISSQQLSEWLEKNVKEIK